MEINKEILEIIEDKKLSKNDVLSLLLSIHFDSIPSFIPSSLITFCQIAGLIEVINQYTIKLRIPLFAKSLEENLDKWEWVKEWRDLFKNAYSERTGNLKTCISRMKVFFSENPEIRKEDVFNATTMYLDNLDDARYLTTSHKFIYDGAGRNRNSKLEEWVEKYKRFESTIPQTTQLHISDQMR